MTRTSEYVPLMLREGWVLERHFGWRVLQEEMHGGLKLLEQKRGPIRRHILLVRGVDEELITAAARAHSLFGQTATTRIVDIDARPAAFWHALAGRPLRELASDRWFGVGTFVIDLTREEAALWSDLSQRTRRMCRKAEKADLRVELQERPDGSQLGGFFALYEPMAEERGLHVPSRQALESMFGAGEAALAICRTSAGEAIAMNIVLLREDAGFYLYGARRERAADGAPHFAHWRTVLALKQRGCAWYDLGQVPDHGPEDGLYTFKKEFGGDYLGYGREYDWSPPLVMLAANALRSGRRLAGLVTGRA